MFRKIFPKLIAVCILVLLAVSLQSAQAQDGVITTNIPAPGGTQSGPAFRLIPPKYGDYSNMETDPTSITAAERDAVIAQFAKDDPTPLSVVNLWSDVKENQKALQIVNNVPIGGGLYTIILPPGWNKSAKMPVLLSGSGAGQSINLRLWKGDDVLVIRYVAASAEAGRTGIIGAYSNSGGTDSLGTDDHTYKSVGAFFDFIAQNGGDRTRAIMSGGSRGGIDSLMWAINPLKLNYNAVAVFADIPPVDISYIMQRSVQTYPQLGWFYALASHDPNAYRYDSGNGPRNSQYILDALFGTHDPSQLSLKSPIGLTDSLKGKQIVIARGTHDAYFSLAEFLSFDRKLSESSIPHTTIITYGHGHSGNNAVYDQLKNYLFAITSGHDYQVPSGRFLYIDQSPSSYQQIPLEAFIKNDPSIKAAATQNLAFSAEIPSKAGAGLPIDIDICGAPGATFSAIAKDASGKIEIEDKGTLDANECNMLQVAAPTTLGTYSWEFTYNGTPIPSTNTPLRTEGGCGISATTDILKDQPSPRDISSANGETSMSFGVDQYSAQESGCTSPG